MAEGVEKASAPCLRVRQGLAYRIKVLRGKLEPPGRAHARRRCSSEPRPYDLWSHLREDGPIPALPWSRRELLKTHATPATKTIGCATLAIHSLKASTARLASSSVTSNVDMFPASDATPWHSEIKQRASL